MENKEAIMQEISCVKHFDETNYPDEQAFNKAVDEFCEFIDLHETEYVIRDHLVLNGYVIDRRVCFDASFEMIIDIFKFGVYDITIHV